MTIQLDSLVQPTRAENSKTRVVRLHWLLTILIALSLMGASMLGARGVATAQQLQLSAEAINQMQALQAEKASRTPAQQKISSDLLYALKQQRHDPVLSQVPMLRSTVEIESVNTTLVDIQQGHPLCRDSTADRQGGRSAYASLASLGRRQSLTTAA